SKRGELPLAAMYTYRVTRQRPHPVVRPERSFGSLKQRRARSALLPRQRLTGTPWLSRILPLQDGRRISVEAPLGMAALRRSSERSDSLQARRARLATAV